MSALVFNQEMLVLTQYEIQMHDSSQNATSQTAYTNVPSIR